MEDLNPRPGPRVDKRGIRPAPAFAIEQLPGPADARVLRMIGEFDLAASDSFHEHLAAAGDRAVARRGAPARVTRRGGALSCLTLPSSVARANSACRCSHGESSSTSGDPYARSSIPIRGASTELSWSAT